MKQLNSFFVALLLLAASCSNESVDIVEKAQVEAVAAPVRVYVNDFSITQGEFPDASGEAQGVTRATAVGSYNGVQVLTLAFYKSDGSEQFKATHTKGGMPEGKTFGEFSTTLPLGSYTMVVLGYVLYDDDELTLTSPTQAEYTGGCVRETFAATQTVNITNTSAVELTATLNRIIACLQVISIDGKTANVNKVRMTFAAGGMRFSPTTGLATVNTGSASTVGVSAAEGATSTSTGYVFLTTDEQTMDVTIETLDAGGNTIYTKTVENVPLKRNRKTKLTGAIYGASAAAGSFQVNTSWLDEEDPINF